MIQRRSISVPIDGTGLTPRPPSPGAGVGVETESSGDDGGFESQLLPLTPEDEVDNWLSMLERLLRMPGDENQSICAELREHVGERVRDLIIAGEDESAAVRRSIGELGDVAELAQRFFKANQDVKRRRRRMHFMTIGIGVAAVATGAIVVTNSNSEQLAVSYEREAIAAEPPDSVQTKRITVESTMTLDDVFKEITVQTEMDVVPRWYELVDVAIEPETELGMDIVNVKVVDALKIITQMLEGYEVTAWRFQPEWIEFGLQESFDREETELVAYSVGRILRENASLNGQSVKDAADELTMLLFELVSPDDWRENGGDMASLQVVGSKMFIEAPKRMHKRILWILNQFETDEQLVNDSFQATGANAGGIGVGGPTTPGGGGIGGPSAFGGGTTKTGGGGGLGGPSSLGGSSGTGK